MEKTRIRQHFENVMLNSRLMKQITVAMECLATVTASVVSERYERLSFQNARFLLFMSMDALNFHVQPSTPFNSIYLALIFGASSKWIRLLNDRMEKRERERKKTRQHWLHTRHTRHAIFGSKLLIDTNQNALWRYALAICSCYYITPKTIDWFLAGRWCSLEDPSTER